jgi:hypothetical protein
VVFANQLGFEPTALSVQPEIESIRMSGSKPQDSEKYRKAILSLFLSGASTESSL